MKNSSGVIKVKSPDNALQILMSQVISTGRFNFNVYEMRILYQLALVAQRELDGRKIFAGKMSEMSSEPPKEVEMRIADLLIGEEDKNHKRIKDASLSLLNKTIQYEDNEVWVAFNMLYEAKILKTKETLKVLVNPVIWEVLLDFTRGFHAFELQCAMKFRSVYSMRFYTMVSNPDPKYLAPAIPLEDVKAWFGLQDHYKDNSMFITRVIKTAQADLDKHAPWSFTYELIKTGRKITDIKIQPVARPQNGTAALQQKVAERRISLSNAIPDRRLLDYLRNTIEFSDNELKNNRELWKNASRYFGEELYHKIQAKFNAESVQGKPIEDKKRYVIGALKGMVADYEKKRDETISNFGKAVSELAESKKYKDRRGTPSDAKKVKNYHSDFFGNPSKRSTDIKAERDENYHSSF